MYKKTIGILTAVFWLMLSVIPVAAHVVVLPTTVGVGASQLFTVGVPNEEVSDTISVRIIIPDGVYQVMPQVKQGWTITEKKIGEGEQTQVSEIVWSGGTIPPGQRDDFSFSAQVSGTEQTINWKAYQTYKDGNIISWDKSPTGTQNDSRTPYSTTQIINDLANKATEITLQTKEQRADTVWQTLTMLALLLSVTAIGIQFRKKA